MPARLEAAEIRPGNQISGPEALLRNMGYHWVIKWLLAPFPAIKGPERAQTASQKPLDHQISGRTPARKLPTRLKP